MKRFFILWIIIYILVIVVPAAGVDGYSRMVYNVYGLQNYSLHWNDRFPPDSNMSIYVEANDVNHRRIVGVDYIFIIRDSNFNIVDTEVKESRRRNYDDNDFIVFKRLINESWEDGYYTAQIHIYDLLNDSLVEQYYDNVTTTLVDETNESDILPDIPYMNRGFIRNHSELDAVQHKVIIQRFWIDRYADKYPVNRFAVENLSLQSYSIAPNETTNVSLDLTNNFYDNGTILLDILLDGEKVNNLSIDIDAYSSKQINFNISSEKIGKHDIEIIPLSKNTMGYGLSTSFEVSEQEIKIPPTFDYKDIIIDNLSVEPNQSVAITVTVENKGKPGSNTISLLVNDIPEIEQTVYLNFSEEKDVKFNITKQELGEYRVSLNNSKLVKIFFVATKEAPEQKGVVEEKKISKIYSILGLSILVISMIIARMYVRKKIKNIKKIELERGI